MKKLVFALAVAVLALGAGVASAVIPDANGVVHACYKKDGNLRVIDPSAPKDKDASCKNDETALDLLSSVPATSYGVAQVLVSRGGNPATVWAQYSTPLGSVDGDTASGVFRFTCSAANAPCKLSVAASGPAGTVVWPRVLIHKQELSGGPSTYCEYLDGATNDDAHPFEAVGASLTMGIGGSKDCPGSTGPGGVVTEYQVAAGYYDVWSTFTFLSQ
jgi:hypothetical protein